MYPQEAAQNLSTRLSLYKAHKDRLVSEILHFDKWGGSHFFTALLRKSVFLENVIIDRIKLNELAKSYEQVHDIKLDIDSLFDKDWLRDVLGEIKIPYLTSNAIYHYNKIADLSDEFLFFDDLSQEQMKHLKTKDDLIKEAGGSDSPVAISIEQTKNLFWFERKEHIELPRLDSSRYILSNRKIFGFLSWLQSNAKDNTLRVSFEDCVDIHSRHSAFFNQTPNLHELTSMGFLEPDDSGMDYHLHLHGGGGPERNLLHEQYSALLWQELLDDFNFVDDQERLRFWYYRCIYHQGFVDIEHFFSADMLTRFLDAAQNAVLNDDDLVFGKREYFRLISDNNNIHENSYLWAPPDEHFELKTETASLYEIQISLGLIFRGHGQDVLLRQESRHALTYMIVQLVKCDHPRLFNRLQAIFDKAKEKYFAFWETCLMITHWRPELLPFMVIREKTSSLAFTLLLKAELTNYSGQQAKDIRLLLIREQGNLLLTFLAGSHEIDNTAKARTLFECLLQTTFRKFYIARRDKENDIQIAQDFREVILQTPMPGQHYIGTKKITPMFIVNILPDLIAELEDYQPVDTYQNGLTSLPFLQLDLAVWMMEVISSVNNYNQPFVADTLLQRLAQFFSTVYLNAINITSIDKKDYFGDKQLKPSLPSWSDHRQNDRMIAWDMAFLLLQEYDFLDDFLKPAYLVFNDSEEKYDEANRFTAQKLRTHLFVLIDAFNGLFDKRRKLELLGHRVDEVLTKLELKIKDIVVKHSVGEPAKRRFDIFGESMERWFARQENKELLPVIGALINRFMAPNREAIIQALTQSEQFIRSLKMLDRIVSEKERRRLLKLITGRPDFKELLSDLSFQDMQFVTSTLSQRDDFIAEAEQALSYTEKAAVRHTYTKNENEVFIFRMHLLHAYHKRDLEAIDKLKGPSSNYVHGQHFNTEEEKDFYRALVWLKTGHGQEAYELYDQIASRAKSDRPVVALNRFAAKLQWAGETTDLNERQKLAAEALAEWQKFDMSHSDKKNWPDIEDSVLFDLLDAYEILEDYNQFDNVYAELDIETRMRQDFLDIRVSVLLARKMQHEAENLLAEAKLFHRLANGDYPDFIEALEKKMNTPETISLLAGQYDRIFRLAPEDLIQVIPATDNGGTELWAFLLNEFIGAITDMLNLINSLSKVDHEDKYSDLVMLSLNGRMRNYKWHAANTRSGFSDPDQPVSVTEPANLGLVDFAIFNGQQRLAICEALILEGKDSIDTQKHNLKIFNYDPARRLFYVLVYFKGGSGKFNSAWKKYQEVVEDFIEFPEGYALDGKVTPTSLQPNHDGIHTGVSNHGDGTRLLHIFVNVHYQVELRKKTVNEDKQVKKDAVLNSKKDSR